MANHLRVLFKRHGKTVGDVDGTLRAGTQEDTDNALLSDTLLCVASRQARRGQWCKHTNKPRAREPFILTLESPRTLL